MPCKHLRIGLATIAVQGNPTITRNRVHCPCCNYTEWLSEETQRLLLTAPFEAANVYINLLYGQQDRAEIDRDKVA